MLEKLWPYGYSTIGDVTFESAAYVARYCLKKSVKIGYKYEPKKEVPEYITMSRRPGIGRPWLEKFQADVYNDDKIILRGLTCRPPKYYDNLYDAVNPAHLKQLKERRLKAIDPVECTRSRLDVKLFMQQQKLKTLPRVVEM